MNKEQINILKHTNDRSANKHYCGDSEDMQELCKLELMKYVGKTSFCSDKFFTITKKGIDILNKKQDQNNE